MKYLTIGAAAILALAAPARATYVTASYSGTVLSASADALPGLGVGTQIHVRATYDTAKLVDRNAAEFDAENGTTFTSLYSASLSDDPLASLSITIGPVGFTKLDQINYGTPGSDCGPDCDYGVGNFPLVYYINGSFAGVGNILIDPLGYSIDPDPIADALSGGFGLDGPGEGPYDFYVGRGNADNPFTQGFAVGNFDLSTVSIQAAAPEPASWAMMILGFGLVGSLLRRVRPLGLHRLPRPAEP